MTETTPGQCEAETAMLQSVDVDRIRYWSKLYSSEAHLAGDLAHAQRICDLWQSYGIPTTLARYDVLQNFPLSTSLTLHSPDGAVAFEASLSEDELPEDPTSSPKNGLPAFHGFSANGDVTAELVYANFGTLDDFAHLRDKGVDVRGKIVVCKYAKVFRGLKVRAAQQFGAAAVIIYNDPQEDGEYTSKNGYQAYPHGPARHPSSIQRGSVDFFSVAVGDPTTPGYPSLPGSETKRRDPHHAIPTIPSLPISYADATPFLKALNGLGLNPGEMAEEDGWRGELEGVDYCTGPSTVTVHLSNQVEFKYSPIYNVVGTVGGVTEESIVLGNHHDSWCCGAVDPVSGSAAMNEVARILGDLTARGWKPYRKIILASWDNEEYGLVGSTEWGEDNAASLSRSCVAYINVDESTNGGKFLGALGSPLLDKVMRAAAAEVPSPVTAGKTVYQDWLADQQRTEPGLARPSLALLGTGSDYTVFFHYLGVPSVDMIFNRRGEGVYPYHSNYDSYYWLDKFGDVGFAKHQAMARLWGLVAVKLAGVEVIPFRVMDYYDLFCKHVAVLRRDHPGLDLGALAAAVELFGGAAQRHDARVMALDGKSDPREVAEVNRRMTDLEREFLLDKGSGLPGRPWYRHLIFAPGLWLGYDGVIFPAVAEALKEDNLDLAMSAVGDVVNAVKRAAEVLA